MVFCRKSRGMQMTRLETFIDAAFASTITMLVIAALLAAFRNVPTFTSSIFVIGIFWRGHWLWSRRYGWTMLVTILIYTYPLKAVFGSMWYSVSHERLIQFLAVRRISARILATTD